MKYCSKCMNCIEETDVECPFCGSANNEEIPLHHLASGTILNNKFMVGTALGEGGFGITYIGRDTKLDMRVAIKEYYPSGYVNRSNTVSATVNSSNSSDRKDFFTTGRENFLREAQILAKFSGTIGIVSVRDFFEENNTAYIVMEYLDGQTLKDYIKKYGTLTPQQTFRLLMPVMESLKKVHAQGLIHRDISPDNIMIVDGQVKLLDFGAARNVSAIAKKSLSVVLKPGYAPEEQYRSKGVQGPWTDIYALCATMYKCITGITPDDSTQRVFSDELVKPSALGINIDPTIEAALLKGLNVMQKDRYQSIDELLNGFKGINMVVDDDIKTVYAGMPQEEGDKPTIYSGMLQEEGDKPTVYSGMPQEEGDKPTVYSGMVQKEEVAGYGREQSVEQPIEIEGKENTKKGKKKDNKKKKRGRIIVGVLLLCLVIGELSTCTERSADNIGDEISSEDERDDNTSDEISSEGKTDDNKVYNEVDYEVNNEDTCISFYDVTVTSDDIDMVLSMDKLEQLSFSNCVMDNSVMECLKDISAPLMSLSISECTGFDDYSSISNLSNLTFLYITGCNLTNEQFSSINFNNIECLKFVNLSQNAELSDLAPLASLKALEELNVDKTSVHDFTYVKDCENLSNVSAQNCGITDISTLTNKSISYLYLNNNEISDISNFSNFGKIYTLEIDNNKISDISALASATNLRWLQISDNQISSLQPLSNAENLAYLYVNRNKLTSLDGLENAIQLKQLKATENQIENINGITNCTVLEQFNINNNLVSDISLLGKSAATLERVFLNNNNVSDISSLANTDKLEYLSFDNNKVTSVGSLKDSISLMAISAEHNEIESMTGLENCTKLEYIYLSYNKISDTDIIASLAINAEKNFKVIDLSSNNISELKLTSNKEYGYLAVYNNPINSFSKVVEIKGDNLLFSYVNDMDLTGFDETFKAYNIVDCPKDKQVQVRNSILDTDVVHFSRFVFFNTVEEVDIQTREEKSVILLGTTTLEE